MLKLVRNTLSQMGSLTDRNGKKIPWNYIVQLQKLQEIEGLNLATKLKKQHINWFNQKNESKFGSTNVKFECGRCN